MTPTDPNRRPNRPPHRPARRPQSPPETAVVTALRGGIIRLKVGDRKGVLMDGPVPRETLVHELAVGQEIPVRVMGPGGRPTETNYTSRGLMKEPWARLAEVYRVGDVVRGQVFRVAEGHAIVNLLPHAGGLVPFREIEFDASGAAQDLVRVGELVSVRILEFHPADRRALLSIRHALGAAPRERISLVPGGRPFPRERGEEEGGAPVGPPTAAGAPCGDPGHARAVEERDRMAGELRDLRADLAEVRRELKGARAREEALEAGREDADPASSPRTFLLAVRLEYARKFEEGDRSSYPLRAMRIGPRFLETVRGLDGIPVAKIVEVCVQVASGMVRDLPSREPHRSGQGGSGGAVRASDGAKAWRCYLQNGTPGARRLHWWEVPGERGGGVEFASVGHHDDYDVPE